MERRELGKGIKRGKASKGRVKRTGGVERNTAERETKQGKRKMEEAGGGRRIHTSSSSSSSSRGEGTVEVDREGMEMSGN